MYGFVATRAKKKERKERTKEEGRKKQKKGTNELGINVESKLQLVHKSAVRKQS